MDGVVNRSRIEAYSHGRLGSGFAAAPISRLGNSISRTTPPQSSSGLGGSEMTDQERTLELVKVTMETATETLKACRAIIESLSPQAKPELVGIRVAAKLVSRSEKWLRMKAEAGEITSHQDGKGGHHKFSPKTLVAELKKMDSQPPVRKIRRRKNN